MGLNIKTTDTAIRAQNLSKLYHIGRAQQRYDTLRDALIASPRAPRLRSSPMGPFIYTLS